MHHKHTGFGGFVLLALSMCSLVLTGCGYTTSGSTLASHLKAIHIELFENKISFTSESNRDLYFPLLEVDVRNAISERFLFDGNLKVAEATQSDLVLSGTLKHYQRHALRFTDSDDVQEYRVTITVSLELFDVTKNEIVWSEPSFSGDADYFLSGPQATTEQTAVDAAVKDLARRIVERTIEDW